MYNVFKTLSKISLLFIILGFFQPIACQFTGPEIIEEGFSTPINKDLFFASIALILTLLVPLIALIRFNSSSLETIVTPIFAVLLLLIAYLLASNYNGDYLSKYYFDEGLTTILSGIGGSFIFALPLIFIKPEKKNKDENIIDNP